MEAGTDKSQKPLEIRAFGQKESTATLIPIVSKLRCFFGGPEGDRTLDLTDAKEQKCIVCAEIWLFLTVFANNYFFFRPLLTTYFHGFRGPLWYVLWSSNEPRRKVPARLKWYLCLDGTSEGSIRQRFLRQSNAGNAMLIQRIRQEITEQLDRKRTFFIAYTWKSNR